MHLFEVHTLNCIKHNTNTIWYFFLLLLKYYGTFSYYIGKCTNRTKYQYGTFSKEKSTILPQVLFPTGTFSQYSIGSVGPHLRLFLILNMLLLERSVLKEIVLIALLQNESWNKYLMLRVAGQYPNSGRVYFLPLDGAAYFKN